MITASGVELRAGSRLLLDAATFRIAAGDRVGLVGRNGAGKTTLFRVLGGAAAPKSGVVRREGGTGRGDVTARVDVLGQFVDPVAQVVAVREYVQWHPSNPPALQFV